ncbi:MAG TPA: C1 family peptidase [Puia sp.]|nr:C1 family peptidase [Puia sp.]
MNRRFLSYGWQPDLPDQRDLIYSAPHVAAKKLPKSVDLRTHCPAVYDQGQLGSCTANAIGGAIEFDLMKQKAPVFMPSRLFIYYNERVIENTVSSDNGAQIRDGIKTVNQQGVCNERDWPYNTSEFAQKPHSTCYDQALKHKVLSYHRVTRSISQMEGCLADGFPFVFGFTVYESFEGDLVAKNGTLNMPAKSEKVVGGHAVLAVGYNDTQKRFIVRNSWSDSWGQKGYFTIPYDYLMNDNLSDDFWTVRMLQTNPAAAKKAAKK